MFRMSWMWMRTVSKMEVKSTMFFLHSCRKQLAAVSLVVSWKEFIHDGKKWIFKAIDWSDYDMSEGGRGDGREREREVRRDEKRREKKNELETHCWGWCWCCCWCWCCFRLTVWCDVSAQFFLLLLHCRIDFYRNIHDAYVVSFLLLFLLPFLYHIYFLNGILFDVIIHRTLSYWTCTRNRIYFICWCGL